MYITMATGVFFGNCQLFKCPVIVILIQTIDRGSGTGFCTSTLVLLARLLIGTRNGGCVGEAVLRRPKSTQLEMFVDAYIYAGEIIFSATCIAA